MSGTHVTAALCLGTLLGLVIGSGMAVPEPVPEPWEHPPCIEQKSICPDVPVILNCKGEIQVLTAGWEIGHGL